MSPANRPRNVAVAVGFAATALTLGFWLLLRHRSGELDPVAVAFFLIGGTALSIAFALSIYVAMRSADQAREHAATMRLTEQAEVALRANESKLRALLENAPDAILSVDQNGVITMVNAVAEKMFGYRRAEIIGRPIELLVPARFRDKHLVDRRAYVAQPRTRAMGIGMTLSGQRSDGTEFPVEISLSPISLPDGVTVICDVRDVTERKESERRASTMLRALATIGESATVLAHEIKNPLSAVNAALKALAAKLGLEDQEVLKDLVERMRRIEAMIRRTLSFAKPLDLRKSVCRATDLVEHALSDIRTIPIAGIEVERKIVPQDLRILVDPQLIREVISNLVANAAEALGGAGHIWVSCSAKPDRTVTLVIEDDGPGLPDSIRDRPIQPFVTTKATGTGLGLSICRKIAEEHGGTFAIGSRSPRGTLIRVELPAARAQ